MASLLRWPFAFAFAIVLVAVAMAVVVALPAPASAATTSVMVAADADKIEAIAQRSGAIVLRSFPWAGWHELGYEDNAPSPLAVRDRLASDRQVTAVDTVAKSERLLPQLTPNDPFWNNSFVAGPGLVLGAQWHLTRANFPAAFDVADGTGAVIGIVDSEFNIAHPDLQAKVRNPYSTASGMPDYHTADVGDNGAEEWHGTHVAGIAAAATDNGIGGSGTGFNAAFVPVRITTSFVPGSPVDANFVADLIEALGYLSNQGVSVINLSLGGTQPHRSLADAIAAVRAAGITVVAAAGNFQQGAPYITVYPAAYPGVIAVGNTRYNDSIHPTSSSGSWVDVAAPGTDIIATMDPAAVGNPIEPGAFFGPDGNGYAVMSGTSMAAPVVTGLVALIRARRPDLSSDQVEEIIKATARDLGQSGPDLTFGAGRIDAAAAVRAATAAVSAPPDQRPDDSGTADPTAVDRASGSPQPRVPVRIDRTAPKVRISRVVRRNGSRRVTVSLTCNEACKGTVRIRYRSGTGGVKTIGRRAFSGRKGRSVVVRVTLNRRIKARSALTVQVRAADASNNAATMTVMRRLRN